MPLKKFQKIGLFLLLLFPRLGEAQFEEYNYFSESEINEINTPLQIDSEYFSDMLTYRLPLSMDATFHHADRVYDLSIGSLSGTRFATQYRLKLDTRLNEKFTFRLAYFEKKDFEQSLNHFVLELQHHLNSFVSLVGYTELKSEKKWNDLGAAVLLHWNSEHTLRLYTTWIDSSFNKRTELAESDSRKALAYGFVGRLLPSGKTLEFVEYYGQIQTPLQRSLSGGSSYTHRESKLGLRGSSHLAEDGRFLHWDVGFKRRAEGLQQDGTVDPLSGLWRTDKMDIFFQYETPQWASGILTSLRHWEVNSQDVRSQTFSPHFWYKHLTKDRQKEQLRLGYEASLHQISGPAAFRTADEVNKTIEHRANLRYSIFFSDSAFLHLQFTADLDDPSWEGGNGTFQIVF